MDPLAGSTWSAPGTVAGFVASAPNPMLLEYARLRRGGRNRALDIGCGAGRNLVPLAEQGWTVTGVDLSLPMIEAALQRGRQDGVAGQVCLALACMDALPVPDRSVDLVVAHGIWNLARTGDEFRRALGEAARVARPDAALFVFTFSRRTLPASARPVVGETFVFTQFSGEPQIFLTEEQLLGELAAAGFDPDPAHPLRELNVPPPGAISTGRVPVIYEAAFRRRAGDQ